MRLITIIYLTCCAVPGALSQTSLDTTYEDILSWIDLEMAHEIEPEFYPETEVSSETVELTDSLLAIKLAELDKVTPLVIAPDPVLMKTIRTFAVSKQGFARRALERSVKYFPMFEEYLDKYNMPLELKYLSVIESALKPKARSHAGAVGLWQFMFRTGKGYGLQIDSYIDERQDPQKSTDAACRYLKHLHRMYGDWNLALAAYNAGPGNLNKAIRRSGGIMDYWKLREYLPRETQNYVPIFLAMTYILENHEELGINPNPTSIRITRTDTICLDFAVNINELVQLSLMDRELFDELNPIYKTDIIPDTDWDQCIRVPLENVCDMLWAVDSLRMKEARAAPDTGFVAVPRYLQHEVTEKENIYVIAQKYNVEALEIMAWNDLPNEHVRTGQVLRIKYAKRSTVEPHSTSSSSSSSTSATSSSSDYYRLKEGESLWIVSKKFGIPLARLQSLNKGLDFNRLRPGQKIRLR